MTRSGDVAATPVALIVGMICRVRSLRPATRHVLWLAALASFLTTVVKFFITALVLFVLLKGINALMSIGKKPAAPAAPTTKKCPYCLSEIPIKATRCPHCTSELDKK